MRTMTLIRHAHPDFPLHAHMCLGRTDLPLGAFGRMQAALFHEQIKGLSLGSVFSSPLLRCRETAAFIMSGAEIATVPDLMEQNMGIWDGLSFAEIQKRWPELHEKRGVDPLLVPEGAETLAQVQDRVLHVIQDLLTKTSGDITLITHASVIQAILAAWAGTPLAKSRFFRLPYVGCVQLVLGDDGRFAVNGIGGFISSMPAASDIASSFETAASSYQCLTFPVPPLTPALAESLLTAAAPGERILLHSRAVAGKALAIADALPLPLDRELLISAALLHDVARSYTQNKKAPQAEVPASTKNSNACCCKPDGKPSHAEMGADWICELGFSAAADLIRQHHDLLCKELNEASILYLADKCIRENTEVCLEERFTVSEAKCVTAEAKAAHAARQQIAFYLRDQVNALCGYELVR